MSIVVHTRIIIPSALHGTTELPILDSGGRVGKTEPVNTLIEEHRKAVYSLTLRIENTAV